MRTTRTIGVALVFWSCALLPVANAAALPLAAPLFVTALSPTLLGEHVDRTRWLAVAAGFGEILMIARPADSDTSRA